MFEIHSAIDHASETATVEVRSESGTLVRLAVRPLADGERLDGGALAVYHTTVEQRADRQRLSQAEREARSWHRQPGAVTECQDTHDAWPVYEADFGFAVEFAHREALLRIELAHGAERRRDRPSQPSLRELLGSAE